MPFSYAIRYIICAAIFSGTVGFFINHPAISLFIGLINGYLSVCIANYFWKKKQKKIYGNNEGIVETSTDNMHFNVNLPSIDFKKTGVFKKIEW